MLDAKGIEIPVFNEFCYISAGIMACAYLIGVLNFQVHQRI